MPTSPKPVFRTSGRSDDPPAYELGSLGSQCSARAPAAIATSSGSQPNCPRFTHVVDVENQTAPLRRQAPPSIGLIAFGMLLCAVLCASCLYGLYVAMETEDRWSRTKNTTVLIFSVAGFIVGVCVMAILLMQFPSVDARLHYLGLAGVLAGFVTGMVFVFRQKNHPAHANFTTGCVLLAFLAGFLLEVALRWLQGSERGAGLRPRDQRRGRDGGRGRQ